MFDLRFIQSRSEIANNYRNSEDELAGTKSTDFKPEAVYEFDPVLCGMTLKFDTVHHFVTVPHT